MRYGFRLFLVGALGMAACAFAARGADDPKPVSFDTTDGVTLRGNFWPTAPVAPAKAKDATVLLLHNVGKNGGSSHQDGWDDLARKLSAEGYSVLSFDFRGFGNSHSVSPADFWDPIKGRHNRESVRGANKKPPPDAIDHKDFDNNASQYYPYLVNDISAAKAYLDRHSGGGEVNSSNLILIGAGEGATLGAMWMESQMHLRKVNGIDPKTGRPTLDEPEGRDLVGGVWLDISPKLGGAEMPGSLRNWLVDMGAENKLPMVFIYGKDDSSADALATRALKSIEEKVRADNQGLSADAIKDRLEFTNVKPIEEANLKGSALLTGDTQTWITKYVDKVIDKRGPKDPRAHDMKMDSFLWTFPGMNPIEAKFPGEDNIHIIPVKDVMRSGS